MEFSTRIGIQQKRMQYTDLRLGGDHMTIKMSKDGLPILDQFSEDGFVDCVFKIERLSENENYYTFHMCASFNDERVGVDIHLVKGLKAGFDSEMNLIQEHVYRKGVYFFRSGPESDRLIAAIAHLYKVKRAAVSMVPSETFTAIALQTGEINLENQAIRIKLFGRDEDPDLDQNYYESFSTWIYSTVSSTGMRKIQIIESL
jgi:hypothetical protein